MAEEEKSKDVGSDFDKEPPQSATTALLRTLGTKVLTGLLTVGGLATFAAFSGSIVLWTRFDALQLPAEQIIEVAPREEALIAGAMILLLFGFCGAIATLAVYLIDRAGRATPGMSRGVVLIVAILALVAIWLAGDTALLDRVIASEALLIAFGCILWATYVGGLVHLVKGDVPSLVEGEREQEVESTAFLEVQNGCQKSRFGATAITVAILVALLAGVAAWAGAKLIADVGDADDAGRIAWACGLAAVGLALAGAVLLGWSRFYLDRRREEQEACQEETEAERKQRECEKRKEGWRERRRTSMAVLPRVATKLAWALSWFRLSHERGRRGKPSTTLSFAAPEGTLGLPPDGAPKREPDPRQKTKPPKFKLTASGKLVVAPLALAAVAAPAAILGQRWLAITLAVLIGLGLALWRIADLSKGKFTWYGVAVLLSVPLFGTVALATRNLDDPQAQPVAIIRADDGPAEALQGLYVTETSDRIYFANVATEGCRKDIVGDSGRLLWIPREDVIAMAVGPRQDVDTAARASLEMAYALTPGIETSTGERVALRTGNEATADAGPADAPGDRLETAGPAIRPKFGRGLHLDPPTASPDQTVKLVLPTPEFGGFASRPNGSSLRLNGMQLEVVDEKVTEEGEEELSREWLKFKVPETASSGVVEIECTQLGGQPYLTVPRRPAARVAVRMQTDSRRVVFDSSNSSDDRDESKKLVRTWTVAGLRKGHGISVGADLPPRLAPYKVRLEVTDSDGQTDVVDLRLLRLPQSRFPFGADRPASTRPVERVRRALRRALNKLEPDDPASIQINGHADSVDTDAFNVRLSYRRARWMRKQLFAPRVDGRSVAGGPALTNEDDAVALAVRAFGESCPIVRKQGPQGVNRRVEVFLLGKGASVATPKGCRAGRLLRTSW